MELPRFHCIGCYARLIGAGKCLRELAGNAAVVLHDKFALRSKLAAHILTRNNALLAGKKNRAVLGEWQELTLLGVGLFTDSTTT